MRNEHLEWCKQRAKEYLDKGDVNGAWASFCSDMNKNHSTRGHNGLELGTAQLVLGHLSTVDKMRNYIEGFR